MCRFMVYYIICLDIAPLEVIYRNGLNNSEKRHIIYSENKKLPREQN